MSDVRAARAILSNAKIVIKMVFLKAKALIGGYRKLLIILACAALCFVSVQSILSNMTNVKIRIAVVDEDGSALSEEFARRLAEEDSIEVFACDRAEAERKVSDSSVDVSIVLEKNFESMLLGGEKSAIGMTTSSKSDSGYAASQIISSIYLSMQSKSEAESRLKADGLWDEAHQETFEKEYAAATSGDKSFVRFSEIDAEKNSKEVPVFGQSYARYSGIVGMVLMLCVLSLSVWLSDSAVKSIDRRMKSVRGTGTAEKSVRGVGIAEKSVRGTGTAEKSVRGTGGCYGKLLARISDYLTMLLISAVIAGVALVVKGDVDFAEVVAYMAYCIAISGIAVLIKNINVQGGINIFIQFIAIITSVLGGCFFDVASLGGALPIISLLTPQGHLIRAVSGDALSVVVLCAVGIIGAVVDIIREK